MIKKTTLMLLLSVILTLFTTASLCACGGGDETNCNHTFSEWEETKKASCVAEGEEARMCGKCGEVETASIAAKEHTWVPATCTEAKYCSVCQITEGRASGHKMKNQTCTSSGYCAECGAPGEVVTGHNWNDATCDAPATCSKCGIITGSPLGHNWNDATCDAPTTCSKCGTTTGSPLGHDWTVATCTEPRRCSVCGNSDDATLPHNYVIKDTDPKYISSGAPCQGTTNYYFSCVCGKKGTSTFTVTSDRAFHALNGQPIEDDAVLEHDTPGVTVLDDDFLHDCGDIVNGWFTCDYCMGQVLVGVKIGHLSDLVEMIAVSPTCTEPGSAYLCCDYCGMSTRYSDTYEIPPLGHDYEYSIKKTNSNNNTYLLTKKCSQCYQTSNETVSNVTSEVAREPSCGEAELIVYSCKDSKGNDIVVEVEGERLPHTLNGVYLDLDDIVSWDTPGVKLLASEVVECEEASHGYFMCEVCSQVVAIKIIRHHSYSGGYCIYCDEREN